MRPRRHFDLVAEFARRLSRSFAPFGHFELRFGRDWAVAVPELHHHLLFVAAEGS